MLKPIFETTTEKIKGDYGEFIISPLEQGYGYTLGNALRRVLLTSLVGAAITKVKIKGVRHQFTVLTGLKEDIVELCLNIKQVRLRIKRGKGPFKIKLDAHGPGEVKASNIQTPSEVEIINKDLILGSLADKKSRLQAEMQVERGFGYRLNKREDRKIGLILLDATFTPVIRVAYEVKSARVGQRTDLDKLILKIWTDGTIKPKKALEEAARVIVSHFQQIYEPVFEKKKEKKKEEISSETKRLSVEEIMPTRIANALIKAGYKTIEDLSQMQREDILKVKNFGEKSLKILEKKLKSKGVKFAAQS